MNETKPKIGELYYNILINKFYKVENIRLGPENVIEFIAEDGVWCFCLYKKEIWIKL